MRLRSGRAASEALVVALCLTLLHGLAEASPLGQGPSISFPADTLPVYQEFQVDEPVRIVRWDKPRYPDSLRKAKVEGLVVIRFVVDTTGRIEQRGVQFLRTSQPAFGAAVRAILESGEFAPAKLGGKSVRQLVQQQFMFRP